MSKEDDEEDMLHSDEYDLSQAPAHASEKQLLIGVNSPITPTTQYMLRTVSAFFDLYTMHLHLAVLTGVPTPYPAGRTVAPYPLFPTREHWTQAVVTYSADPPRIGGRYLQVMRIALIVLMVCVCIVAFGLCAHFAHHLVR